MIIHIAEANSNQIVEIRGVEFAGNALRIPGTQQVGQS